MMLSRQLRSGYLIYFGVGKMPVAQEKFSLFRHGYQFSVCLLSELFYARKYWRLLGFRPQFNQLHWL
jgi:hypothetical protein